MRYCRYILSIVIVVSLLIGCVCIIMGNKASKQNNKLNKPPAALSGFGFNLLSALADNAEDSKNILISPFCVASALSLVAAGSTPSSDCQAELFTALGIKDSHEEMSILRAALLSSASKDTKGSNDSSNGVELTMANSIWTTGSIKPDYISMLQNIHGAAAKPLPSNYEPVDNWISQETNGLVKDVLNGPVDPLVVALLVSVVHFHGTWSEQFNPKATQEGTFHAPNGQNRTANFMKTSRPIQVVESVDFLGGASVLRLDYGNGPTSTDGTNSEAEFCALFILPAENTAESINQVISGLGKKKKNFSKIMSSFEMKFGSISIPRFRIDWGPFSLREPLMNPPLGIKSAFTGNNMFLAMSNDPKVHLSDVIHKVVMEVTEEGTTAAAATVAKKQKRSKPRPQVRLNFDRPFVMMVMHVPTVTPLFLGKFVDPNFIF